MQTIRLRHFPHRPRAEGEGLYWGLGRFNMRLPRQARSQQSRPLAAKPEGRGPLAASLAASPVEARLVAGRKSLERKMPSTRRAAIRMLKSGLLAAEASWPLAARQASMTERRGFRALGTSLAAGLCTDVGRGPLAAGIAAGLWKFLQASLRPGSMWSFGLVRELVAGIHRRPLAAHYA